MRFHTYKRLRRTALTAGVLVPVAALGAMLLPANAQDGKLKEPGKVEASWVASTRGVTTRPYRAVWSASQGGRNMPASYHGAVIIERLSSKGWKSGMMLTPAGAARPRGSDHAPAAQHPGQRADLQPQERAPERDRDALHATRRLRARAQPAHRGRQSLAAEYPSTRSIHSLRAAMCGPHECDQIDPNTKGQTASRSRAPVSAEGWRSFDIARASI